MTSRRATFGAFNQGGVPTIACFNKATIPLGVDFGALILAGGYQVIFKNGRWSQVFGSAAKKRRFARAERRGR